MLRPAREGHSTHRRSQHEGVQHKGTPDAHVKGENDIKSNRPDKTAPLK